MDDCHALYLWQEILRAIIGSVDSAHTKYEADCLDWRSVIDDCNELLCQADMLQFKELCDNNYLLCKDEYDLYKKRTQVIEARPRHINIREVCQNIITKWTCQFMDLTNKAMIVVSSLGF